MDDRLVLLLSAPRSGSTLLQRILASHSDVRTHPETHVLVALAHLGYFRRVDVAPYHVRNAEKGVKDLVVDLPRGEADYLDACRAYADVLFGRLLESTGERYYLEKTPANALVLDVVTRLYPRARYVVLTRHPVAIVSSYAHTFFDGDLRAAHSALPILDRYVPALAGALRAPGLCRVHVRYEDLVRDPEPEVRRITDLLDLPFEPGMIEYGSADHASGLGDPKVERHSRPTTASVERWAADLAADPSRRAFVEGVLAGLDRDEIRCWGYDPDTLLEPVDAVAPSKASRRPSPYGLGRTALRRLRKNIHRNSLGRAIRRVRDACDVLLRG